MSSEPAIVATDVGKTFRMFDRPHHRLVQMFLGGRRVMYREFRALDGVSFTVPRGTTTGIIGRNGSGKSTLLQIVSGTLEPTEGEVRVRGRVAALLELGAGFNPEFTGRDNVRMNATILGLDNAEIDRRFDDIVAFSEIGAFIDQPVKTYSSGMFVRLAFAVAIHTRPEVFIVDEALAVGDFKFQAKCFQWIREFRESGGTVLFVSHDVGAVRQFCDSVIWLENGRVVEQGDTQGITARYLERMLGGEIAAARPEAADPSSASGGAIAGGGDAMPEMAPLARWGTATGAVLGCAFHDAAGRRVDVLPWNERVELRIRVRVPVDAPPEALGVAASLKSLSGTDLLVFSTWDEARRSCARPGETVEVRFAFDSPLGDGKYTVALALEDRRTSQPHYLDYVDGAVFFAATAPRTVFGLVQIPVVQRIERMDQYA